MSVNATIKIESSLLSKLLSGAAVRARLSAGAAAAAPQPWGDSAISEPRGAPYPAPRETRVLPLLPLEKHRCHQRQRSGWERAPQHLMEHGKAVLLAAENATGSPADRGEPLTPGGQALSGPGPSEAWRRSGLCSAGRSGGVAALAKQAGSEPRWQVFPILLQDKGSKEAPNGDALGQEDAALCDPAATSKSPIQIIFESYSIWCVPTMAM